MICGSKMAEYSSAPLSGALNDPCPVCCLIPVKAVNFGAPEQGAEPEEGAVVICFGCALVQRIHNGMRCALTEDEAEFIFYNAGLIEHVLAVAKLRSQQPWRVADLVRQQKERDNP